LKSVFGFNVDKFGINFFFDMFSVAIIKYLRLRTLLRKEVYLVHSLGSCKSKVR
jgi:hypothetical protein